MEDYYPRTPQEFFKAGKAYYQKRKEIIEAPLDINTPRRLLDLKKVFVDSTPQNRCAFLMGVVEEDPIYEGDVDTLLGLPEDFADSTEDVLGFNPCLPEDAEVDYDTLKKLYTSTWGEWAEEDVVVSEQPSQTQDADWRTWLSNASEERVNGAVPIPDKLKEALDDPDSLMPGLSWASTPQGTYYWASRFTKEVPLSAEDKEFLSALLAKHQELNAPKEAPPPVNAWEAWAATLPAGHRLLDGRQRGSIDSVLTEGPRFLKSAFLWSATPQGHDYWEKRKSESLPLSEDDREFLLALAARRDEVNGVIQSEQTAPSWAEWVAGLTLETEPDVKPKEIQRALDGDIDGLLDAFTWDSTPQGGQYWSIRDDGDAAVSDDDKAFLQALLDKYKELNAPPAQTQEVPSWQEWVDNLPEDFVDHHTFPADAILMGLVLKGNLEALTEAFHWSATPQGYANSGMYWYKRTYTEVPLSDDDLAFIKALKEKVESMQATPVSEQTAEEKVDWKEWMDTADIQKAVHSTSALQQAPSNHRMLGNAIVWCNTPQGKEYWALRATGDVSLSEDDKLFLKTLYIKSWSVAFLALPVLEKLLIFQRHFSRHFEVSPAGEPDFRTDEHHPQTLINNYCILHCILSEADYVKHREVQENGVLLRYKSPGELFSDLFQVPYEMGVNLFLARTQEQCLQVLKEMEEYHKQPVIPSTAEKSTAFSVDFLKGLFKRRTPCT